MAGLTVEMWPIERCIPYCRNPRKNDEQVDRTASAIKEFGFRIPIVAKSDGSLVDGHLRLKAAQKLGLKEVPVALADELTEAQVKAFRILANKSANWAEWEPDLLKLELQELQELDFDLELTGFELPELEDIMGAGADGGTEGQTDPDAVPEAQEEPVSRLGDVWLLGRHRLMCGDSTDAGSLALLMNGEKADICFASPPYNMQASGIAKAFNSNKVKDAYGIKDGTYDEFSDALCREEYASLLNKSLDCCLENADEVFFNIGILAESKAGIIDMLAAHKNQLSDILVWNKDHCLPLYLPTQKHMVSHICELIFCFNHSGDRTFKHSQWELGEMHNRIDVSGQHSNEFSKIHHATFPVELPVYVIKWFTKNSVLDCFGGTGSTLIAAEQLGRKSYTMELSPRYVDVIVMRWQEFTGQKATLESSGKTFDETGAERA